MPKQNFRISEGLTIGAQQGTAPIVTSSTTLVTNLNVQYLNGQLGSYYLNASNLNAGTLPAGRFNDTSHGDRGGGSLHAVATPTTAGFMSAADKTNLDSIVSSGSATSFVELTDTPNNFNSASTYLLRVNSGGTAVEFVNGASLFPSLTGSGASGTWGINVTGTAGSLANARDITITGDASWSVSFDGSGNVSSALTLANSGVSAGTYRKVTVNSKGLITSGENPTTLSGYGITDALPASQKGAPNGVASLDGSGFVPSSQLPSFVDDVLEYADFASLPVTGNTGKIYVTLDENKIFRWSGTVYIEVSPTSGNADSATKLATPRTISMSGDGSWSVSFDGTGNVTDTFTLANSGVSVGTYTKVTVTAKGIVTSGEQLAASDIPNISASKITSGTLPVERGGTGAATLTGILKGNGTSAVSQATEHDDYIPGMADARLQSIVYSAATTAADQVADSFAAATYRSAKYEIQLTQGSNYQSSEIRLIHDGTSVYITEFGTLITDGMLGTFDADINSGNVRLLLTPTSSNTTLKAIRKLIEV